MTYVSSQLTSDLIDCLFSSMALFPCTISLYVVTHIFIPPCYVLCIPSCLMLFFGSPNVNSRTYKSYENLGFQHLILCGGSYQMSYCLYIILCSIPEFCFIVSCREAYLNNNKDTVDDTCMYHYMTFD